MKLKGAQIIVETLIEQGASTVFGYPGGQVIDIYLSLIHILHSGGFSISIVS